MLQLKVLEKEEQSNTKSSRRQEIVKIRAESNEIETKRNNQKIDKIIICFFEKINKFDKPLVTVMKRRSEKTQITEILDEKGNIMIDTIEIQKIIRNYFKNLYSKKSRKS